MQFTGAFAMQATVDAVASVAAVAAVKPKPAGVEDKVDPDGVVPADVVRFLARLRLLEGVPFNYLVPDAAMLPLETIRFFYVDRNWLDALVQGALSVGTVNSADRAKLAGLHAVVRKEVDVAERLVRMKDADAPAVDAQGRPLGVAGPMTGFLMRSRIVSGWPGLHVRAYSTDTREDDQTIPDMDTSPDRVRLLRMERLAPAVLLVLFDGVPAVVHVEEPRSGVQFGVRVKQTGATASAVLPLRNVNQPNAGFLQTAGNQDRTIAVKFRKGAPGVVNLHQLAADLRHAAGTNMVEPVRSDQFAIELLRFPIRQVFGDTTVDPGHDAFVPTFKIDAMVQSFSLAQQVLGLQE
ncbi:MAG TPA: hypothetical protein VFO65_08560 [Acidimicrobiales bacterium]|nr:hypothetical protein [Acidimicrobiales bacterium]